MKKPNPEIFIKAAEMLAENQEFRKTKPYGYHSDHTKFSCDCINMVVTDDKDDSNLWSNSPEYNLYNELFNPFNPSGDLGWWPVLDSGKWDYESRYIALLLAAEIAAES